MGIAPKPIAVSPLKAGFSFRPPYQFLAPKARSLYSATRMATFNLPGFDPACPVYLTSDLQQDQLLSFPAFKTWTNTLRHSLALQTSNPNHEFHKAPYKLREIRIQSVDWFGSGEKKRLGFVKLQAQITNDEGAYLPGAAGALSFSEVPAGMLDDSGTFAGGAAKEIEEETGLQVRADELLDMTALAMEGEQNEQQLQKGVYSTAGGCDEFVPIFLYQKRISRKELQDFQGKLTGLRNEGEKITLKVVKLDDLWKEGVRDSKTLSALALYQNLKRVGKL